MGVDGWMWMVAIVNQATFRSGKIPAEQGKRGKAGRLEIAAQSQNGPLKVWGKRALGEREGFEARTSKVNQREPSWGLGKDPKFVS